MPRPKLTPEERRERARLRSERWRRPHGTGPRKPAERPWLALGISRSTTYYRRRAKARQQLAPGRARPAAVAGGGAADASRQARGGECDHGAEAGDELNAR